MNDIHTSLSFNRCLLKKNQELGDGYNVGVDSYGYHFFASQPFLRVNNKGERFHNESAPYDFVLNASSIHSEADRYWHQVWDGRWKQCVERFHTVGCSTLFYREGADHDAYIGELGEGVAHEIEDFVNAGYIIKAESLHDLAEMLEFNSEAQQKFLDTCEKQNKNFDAQFDPDFGKEAFRLSELRTPFYYASVKSCGLTLCTLDGVQVNEELRPYGKNGEPILGVYVVGNDQGSFYAGNYPNLSAGLNAGRCATFGRMTRK